MGAMGRVAGCSGGRRRVRPDRSGRGRQRKSRRRHRREAVGAEGGLRARPLRRPRRGGGDPLSWEKVNIEEKAALFDEQWKPKIVAGLNGQHVKLVKFLGEFVWYHHDEEELFLVVKGRFRMESRGRRVWVEEE